jgi:nucleotide-binding universal stress UspA family protein
MYDVHDGLGGRQEFERFPRLVAWGDYAKVNHRSSSSSSGIISGKAPIRSGMASADTVLLAYDGSESAQAAIQQAANLFSDRPLLVLSVARSVAATGSASIAGLPAGVAGDAISRLNEEAQRQAEALADEGATAAEAAGLEATAAGVLSDRTVWGTIVRVTEDENVAAVIVGSRGRSDLRSALLGSVSSGVIHHCDRPVVVIRGPSVNSNFSYWISTGPRVQRSWPAHRRSAWRCPARGRLAFVQPPRARARV